jgi:hypothetical protein
VAGTAPLTILSSRFLLVLARLKPDVSPVPDWATGLRTMEDFAMISRTIMFSLLAVVSVIATVPSAATAGTTARDHAVSFANAVSHATDFSAARKRRHAYRGSAAARNAFGSIVGDTVYGGSLYGGSPYEGPFYGGGYPGYGYGIGDNSRNQTW